MSDTIDSRFLAAWLRRSAEEIEAARDELCALDGEVGDGDHGISMADGLAAAACAAEDGDLDRPAPQTMQLAASAFLQNVGATVGPLYASAFLNAGTRLQSHPDLPALLGAIAEGIAARGKASPGDRTMIDVWHPAWQAALNASEAGGDISAQAAAALRAAEAGVEATKSMIAARGRAVRLGSRSLGYADPGAQSAALMVRALLAVAEERR